MTGQQNETDMTEIHPWPKCCTTLVDHPIKSGEFAYRVCARCGHGSLDPLPPEDSVKKVYEKAYFVGGDHFGYPDYGRDEALHRRNARHRLKMIRRVLALSGGTVLDFGSAYGYFLAEAERSGWMGTGVEISAWAREQSQKVSSARVVRDMESLDPSCVGTFDLVCLFQVLEHCLDPEEVLRSAYRLLKPGGAIAIETWDKGSRWAKTLGGNWQQIAPPSVVHLFTRASLEELLQRSGFGAPTMRTMAKYVSPQMVMNTLAQKAPFLERVTGWKSFAGSKRVIMLPYFMPDLIFAAARKPAGLPSVTSAAVPRYLAGPHQTRTTACKR